MEKYLSPAVVSRSFKRLSSREPTGKKHLERTSALMYFLAFDATCKHFKKSILDFNPDNLEGKNNRRQFELEFVKVVLLEKTHNGLKQVIELGKVNTGGTIPEQRVSSNFFSVPLKNASERETPCSYPLRPAAPLLKIGFFAADMKWGIGYHDDWITNFPRFLSEIKEPTPFLDLAVFICRDGKFEEDFTDYADAVCNHLEKRFTKALSNYWISRIDKEKILDRYTDEYFIGQHSLFSKFYKDDSGPAAQYIKMKKHKLVERIIYLENKLAERGLFN